MRSVLRLALFAIRVAYLLLVDLKVAVPLARGVMVAVLYFLYLLTDSLLSDSMQTPVRLLCLCLLRILTSVRAQHLVGRQAGVGSVILVSVAAFRGLQVASAIGGVRTDAWKVILLFWEMKHIVLIKIDHALLSTLVLSPAPVGWLFPVKVGILASAAGPLGLEAPTLLFVCASQAGD